MICRKMTRKHVSCIFLCDFPNETAMTKNYAQVQGGPMMGEAGRYEALWFPENPSDFLITPQWIEDYWLSDDHTFYGG